MDKNIRNSEMDGNCCLSVEFLLYSISYRLYILIKMHSGFVALKHLSMINTLPNI